MEKEERNIIGTKIVVPVIFSDILFAYAIHHQSISFHIFHLNRGTKISNLSVGSLYSGCHVVLRAAKPKSSATFVMTPWG